MLIKQLVSDTGVSLTSSTQDVQEKEISHIPGYRVGAFLIRTKLTYTTGASVTNVKGDLGAISQFGVKNKNSIDIIPASLDFVEILSTIEAYQDESILNNTTSPTLSASMTNATLSRVFLLPVSIRSSDLPSKLNMKIGKLADVASSGLTSASLDYNIKVIYLNEGSEAITTKLRRHTFDGKTDWVVNELDDVERCVFLLLRVPSTDAASDMKITEGGNLILDLVSDDINNLKFLFSAKSNTGTITSLINSSNALYVISNITNYANANYQALLRFEDRPLIKPSVSVKLSTNVDSCYIYAISV